MLGNISQWLKSQQMIKISALTFTTVCHTGQVCLLLWALVPHRQNESNYKYLKELMRIK